MNRGGRRRPRLGKSLTRPLQGTPARPEARGRRGRRRGSSGTSAARRTVVGATPTRLRRRSRSGEGRARERAAEMERGVGGGRWGGGRGVEGRGRPYPLRVVVVEAVRRGSPLLRPRSGNRGEDDPGRGWAGPAGVGRGSGQALCTWPSAQWPVLLHFCFVFYFFLFSFIYFS